MPSSKAACSADPSWLEYDYTRAMLIGALCHQPESALFLASVPGADPGVPQVPAAGGRRSHRTAP
jgi:hypothetical protein